MRDRLTAHYVYYDGQHGYEALGHDAYSQRPFIEITKKLALYEDTGYTPKEVAELRDKLLGNTADDWMGMYHIAADRSDKAEAEVERLKTNMTKYEICYDTTRESYDKAEAENAKLRKVVDAAKEWINCPCEDIRECLECTAFKFRNALAELDEGVDE